MNRKTPCLEINKLRILRFMVPMHSKNERRLSMNRPTPGPSQEGSERSSAPCQFPSWEGLGVGSWSQCIRKKRKGAFHEPPSRPRRRARPRRRLGGLSSRTTTSTRTSWFKGPLHAKKRKEPLHLDAGNLGRCELARTVVPAGLGEICQRVRKPASHLSNR